MASHLTEQNSAAVNGDAGAINVVVANQAESAYVAIPLDISVENGAEFKNDPNLDGRALDPDKLDGIIENVNPNQTYYSFDDVSEKLMGELNDALRSVSQLNAHIQATITGNDAQMVNSFDIPVTDTNAITGAVQNAQMHLDMLEAEVNENGVEGMGFLEQIEELREELGGAEVGARFANETWFSYDKVPAPGMEYVDPNYDQFLPDIVDLTPNAEHELQLDGLDHQ